MPRPSDSLRLATCFDSASDACWRSARAFGHPSLVLGAWGCGAFANDPARTARDFRQLLEADFSGAFGDIVFAITDWSPERRFLGRFREVFAADNA